ncbi:hypothetical protein RI056_16715 [Komagataeibacter nataicola]|uniref:hypothetical protein n=1 Tax=Komagataeibacter nataicola TaxID=265960 RepID=UPI0028ACFAD0|nr:hypothetical protein [Komagataeibacter nataicola]WNM08465.1 hypothetical protein RI056_16715 [Komagataeibacter nataicola]
MTTAWRTTGQLWGWALFSACPTPAGGREKGYSRSAWHACHGGTAATIRARAGETGCGYGLRQIPAPCGIDGIGCDP